MTDTILSATAGKAGKLVIHKWYILECGKQDHNATTETVSTGH